MLKKPQLLLSFDKNILMSSEIDTINQKILSKEDFSDSLLLKQKDLTCFNLILNITDNNTYSMIDFFIKNTQKKFKDKKIDAKEETKYFLIRQIFLLFIVLSKQKQESQIYKDIYKFLLKIQSSLNIINISDILEIIRFNIIISMENLFDRFNIFLNSLNFVIYIYKTNINQKNKNENEINVLCDSIAKILETIYKYLYNNKNKVSLLQRIEILNEKLSLFDICYFYNSKNETKLNDIIEKIILLIYSCNHSRLINENILENIKDGFFELKKGNSTMIKNIINLLTNKLHFIHFIYKNENKLLENDLYFPKNYFVFNSSKESGIKYNTEYDLFKYNFILIFTFKCSSLENANYPLITFQSIDSRNNDDIIILNLSLQNKHLSILFQKEYQELNKCEIHSNKAYMIALEFYKNNKSKDKLKLTVNYNELTKAMNSEPIIYNGNISINLGYIDEYLKCKNSKLNNLSLNFDGIIGPILILIDTKKNSNNNNSMSKLLEDNNLLISDIFKMNGFYENIIYMNNNNNYKNNLFIYEDDKKYQAIKDFFNKSEKLKKTEFFFISPLSIINSIYNNTNIFFNYFNNLQENSNNETFLQTLAIPSLNARATYGKISLNFIQSFIQNDGIHLLCLILDYYYNILSMIIEYTDYSDYENKLLISTEINQAMVPILDLITEIINIYYINDFKNELDTFGFCLMKTLNLLGDNNFLNFDLVKCLINNMYLLMQNYYEKKEINNQKGKVSKQFINKLFVLICNTKYYNSSNIAQLKNLFKLFNEVLLNNKDLITIEIFESIINFSFILSQEFKPDQIQEYKSVKKEYETLIGLFFSQNNSIHCYFDFLKIISQKSFQIREKYKLLKIFYLKNKTAMLIKKSSDNVNKGEKNEIINELKNKHRYSFKTHGDKIKKQKNNNQHEETEEKKVYFNLNASLKLIDIYENILEKKPLIPNKNRNLSLRYLELLKSIVIQLIYEQVLLIVEAYPERIYYFFSSEKLKKEKEEKQMQIDRNILRKNVKHNTTKTTNIQGEDFKDKHISELRNKKKINFLFDNFIKFGNISFYTMKSWFSCLFDNCEKNEKLNYIKGEKSIGYEKFNSIFGEFNKYKKELLFQILELFDLVEEEGEKNKIMNLIFHFIQRSIEEFETIKNDKNITFQEIKYIKKKFFHLFESKFLMNKIFNLCLSYQNNIPNDSFLQNIIQICNKILEYHPYPFVFSFLRELIENKKNNKYFSMIFIGISEYIKSNLKKDSELIKNQKILKVDSIKRSGVFHDYINFSHIINSYLYFNEIKFIKSLIKLFQIYPINMQIIIEENNYKLLYCLQNLIVEFASSRFIYDINLYIFHPISLINISQIEAESIEKKKNEKNVIKLLQTPQAKLLSNQILFVDILELIFLIIYNLWTMSSHNSNINIQEKIESFINSILEKIYIKDHFISYYLDIFNTKKFQKNAKQANIDKLILSNYFEEVPEKYSHWIEKNIETKDVRLFSALSYLVFLKYEYLMIIHDNQENKINHKNILDIFETKFNFCFQIDLIKTIKYFVKSKDNKKIEIIFEKEELENKEFRIQKNYYKLLMNYLSKIKNYSTEHFNSFAEDIGKKYINDLEEFLKISSKSNEINDIQTEFRFSQKRKDSFNKYFQDEDDSDSIKINSNSKNLSENERNSDKYINFFDMNNNLSVNETNTSYDKIELNFFFAKEPILCTKRDLILKYFGYFFFDEYIKDERFIKMKNYFMQLYPSSNPENNYNEFENQMKFNYPSILKNFSNNIKYYPRIFLRPDNKFFKHKNLYKSHDYLKIFAQKQNLNNNIYKYITSEENNRIMNFEYSHGLLNQDNYNLFTVQNALENISSSKKIIQCEYLSIKSTIPGKIKIIKNWMIFQNDTTFDYSLYEKNIKYRLSSRKDDIDKRQKQIIIPLNLIEQIIYRKFLFYSQALEIFLFNGKSYLFNFYENNSVNEFILNLKEEYKIYNINLPEIINDPIAYFHNKNYTNDWLEGKLSTLRYLLLVNKFSGRTYNDLTQYLIFPWLLKDYTDIKDKDNFRKMEFPMAVQDEDCLELVKKEYEKECDSEYKSYFSYHYSNSANICLYLLRLNPFTYNQIKLNGNFDSPERQIESLQDMCYVLREFKENSELVPEYFFMVECFLNLNFNYFGVKIIDSNKKSLVNNIKLNVDFTSLFEMVLFHKNFINSKKISSNINKWIDNIFGENQITSKKNVINSFPSGCYEKFVKEGIDSIVSEIRKVNPNSQDYEAKTKKAIKDIRSLTDRAYLFGQCPTQLFQKSHPQKIEQMSDLNEECKVEGNIVSESFIPISDALYFNCKNENNNIYFLTNDLIFVCDKSLKPIKTIEIKKIYNIFPYREEEKEKELINLLNKFIYKNLIFDIEDCRIFFIGGYFDNSFVIYYLNKKNETSNLSIITESRVTCIKKVPNKNGFLTGHLNGKIIKWKYKLNKDGKDDISSLISLKKSFNFIGHKSFIQSIEINEDLRIVISSSNDGIILIRKLYDFELLNVIKYNCINKCLLHLCFDNQIIIATFYNKKEKDDIRKKIKINTYSVNGIKLGSVKKNITMPLIIQDTSDKLLIFINKVLYEVYVTFKEWENIIDLNKEKYKKFDNLELISYGYDTKLKILFCLFENRKMVKISLQD